MVLQDKTAKEEEATAGAKKEHTEESEDEAWTKLFAILTTDRGQRKMFCTKLQFRLHIYIYIYMYT